MPLTLTDEDDGTLRWKENMDDKAQAMHGRKQAYRVADLARMIYDDMLSTADVVRRWRGEDHDGRASKRTTELEQEDGFFKRRAGSLPRRMMIE